MLRHFDLNPAFLRGQCYAGASNISGLHSEVNSVIQEEFQLAMHTHIAAAMCLKSCQFEQLYLLFH